MCVQTNATLYATISQKLDWQCFGSDTARFSAEMLIHFPTRTIYV